jgi:hypothetical protein
MGLLMENEKKPVRLISVCLILLAWICSDALRAQDAKLKHRIFIGAGIGFCDVVCRERGMTVSDLGPSFSAALGLYLSDKISLQLEYGVTHPNDDEPRTSDLMVITTIYNGDKISRFEVVRSPIVLKTKFLLLSFQRRIFNNYFYRIGVGFGGNYSNGYYTSEDAVLKADISREIAYGFGFAGGYERNISDRLALALEASVRWSSGEDSSTARFVFGLGTVVKWDF